MHFKTLIKARYKVLSGVLLLTLISSCALLERSSEKSRTFPPIHLVLGLDGVGYETFKKLYDGGYFREFYQPQPMVASFPTLSDPNWSRIMNAPMNESYTKAFFNMKYKTENGGVGRPEGSLLNHITKAPAYEDGFNFKAEGMFQHFAMMTWTETSAFYWLDSLEKEFLSTKGVANYFAFIMNTDLIAHVAGEKPLLEYLAELDRRLKRLREKVLLNYGYKLDITIVSDHGNYWTKPQQILYEEHFKKYGWKLAETLVNKNDVGFVVPEIIAFAAFYTLPGQEERLALDLSHLEGIHISSFVKSENVVHVVANNSKDLAEIKVNPEKSLVSYKVLKGQDPLKQQKYFDKEWLTFREYFNKSLESDYPYSAVSLWEGFYKNSHQPASVLVSPQLGRVFANSTLKMLTAMRGLASTHGSLHRAETHGVLISTEAPYPAIRPEDFRELISLKEYTDRYR